MLPIPTTPLALCLFGPFEARVHGRPLPRLRTRKGNWLLALLALRAGREVDRGWVAGTLWPNSSESLAAHSLRTSLADLRRALGEEAGCLRSPTTRTLALDLAGAFVDVAAFDAAIQANSAGSLAEAVALYRGPLLEECTEAWAFEERQAREQAYLGALESLAEQALARNDPEVAAGYLQRATAVDPLRESAQRGLMRALAAGGNYGAALVVYRELRLRLHREINVQPDPETITLFEQLRAEARQRARCRPAPVREPTARERQPLEGSPLPHGRGSGAGQHAGPPQRAASERAAGELPLFALARALAGGPMVGREAELGTLRRQMEAAAAGRGGTVFLAGEPGIGKTRLATEANECARQRGFLVLSGHCHEEGAAPYQPFAEAVREYLHRADPQRLEQTLPPPVAGELVRIVPQIAGKVEVPQVPLLSAEPARQALLEAAQQFIAAIATQEAPLLLFLDDLHWADEGSLALLHHLARRAKELRLLVVGTYRDLPPDLQRPLEQTLAALNRERAAERLPLRRLPEAGVAEIVTTLLPDPPATFVPALHRETEGNPFFLEEMLKHLVEEGKIYRDAGRWQVQPLDEFSLPESVKVTIGRRLERLSEESREALTLAAVIGPQFRFELLLQASELEEAHLVEIVEEWLGARLVVEQQMAREELYRFQHALIRDARYEAVSLRRRARLHERVGLALEAISAATEEHLEELAHHFAQARSGAAMEKGVDYCLRAGKRARYLNASEAAIRHLTAALELLDGLPQDEPHLRKRWDVVGHLCPAYSHCRAYEPAQAVLWEYLELAERAGYPSGMADAHYALYWSLVQSSWAAGVEDPESPRQFGFEHWEKCLQIAEEHGLTDWRARARVDLACALIQRREDLPRAETLLSDVLQAPETLSRPVFRGSGTKTSVGSAPTLQSERSIAAKQARSALAWNPTP